MRPPFAVAAGFVLLMGLATTAWADDPGPKPQETTDLRLHVTVVANPARPRGLTALYVADGLFGAADALLTYRNLAHGAMEVNPLMRANAHDPTGMTVAKVAALVTTMATAERLWRTHHPRAAMVVTALTVTASGWVAVHNYQVWNRTR